MGQARFILKYGVLRWGLPMFVFMTIWARWFAIQNDWFKLIIAGVFIYPTGGALFGYFVWTQTKKRFG